MSKHKNWRQEMMGHLKEHMQDEDNPKELGEMGRMMEMIMPREEMDYPMPVRMVGRTITGRKRKK